MKDLQIPKGTKPEDVKKRCQIIKSQLKKLKGKTIICPCLGNVPVDISARSIDEISTHAAKKYSSTLAALDIKNAIKKARFFRMHIPKDNMQQRKMGFLFLYVLKCESSNGETIKITIGVRERPIKFLQYCITVE